MKACLVCASLAIVGLAACRIPPDHEWVDDEPALACGSASVNVDVMVPIAGGELDGRRIDDFEIGRTEVTSRDYQACVIAGACEPASSDGYACTEAQPDTHPINCVSQAKAARYCTWRGSRLPTAWEWVWAARGGQADRRYPWGSEPATCERAIVPMRVRSRDPLVGCGATVWPVGSRPRGATIDGVLDMVGNVSEWVSTETRDGSGIELGGWFWDTPDRVDDFTPKWAGSEDSSTGFRCARDVGERCR